MNKTNIPITERVVGYTTPRKSYWTIPSEKGDKLLLHGLLPSMTQDSAARYSSEEGFHPMSLPEHFELFEDLSSLREKGGEVEQARKFLRSSLKDHLLATLTRALYQPQGKDEIIHGYGTNSQIKKQAKLTGLRGNILEVLTKEASLALTGKSPEEAAELMEYINGTPTRIWRLSKKPNSIKEGVMGFYAILDWIHLSCDRNPENLASWLGVRAAKN